MMAFVRNARVMKMNQRRKGVLRQVQKEASTNQNDGGQRDDHPETLRRRKGILEPDDGDKDRKRHREVDDGPIRGDIALARSLEIKDNPEDEADTAPGYPAQQAKASNASRPVTADTTRPIMKPVNCMIQKDIPDLVMPPRREVVRNAKKP